MRRLRAIASSRLVSRRSKPFLWQPSLSEVSGDDPSGPYVSAVALEIEVSTSIAGNAGRGFEILYRRTIREVSYFL